MSHKSVCSMMRSLSLSHSYLKFSPGETFFLVMAAGTPAKPEASGAACTTTCEKFSARAQDPSKLNSHL